MINIYKWKENMPRKKKKRNTERILTAVDPEVVDEIKRLTGCDNRTKIINDALDEYKRKLLRENLLKLQGKIRRSSGGSK
jgi:hypothetical protein